MKRNPLTHTNEGPCARQPWEAEGDNHPIITVMDKDQAPAAAWWQGEGGLAGA